MCSFGNKEINISSFLWKLHGKKSTRIDLLLTYLLAFLVMIFSVINAMPETPWKLILIGFLAIDTGGGMMSNFTKGTIEYYRNSDLSPHAYIWFHLLQTGLMILVYPEHCVPVLVISVFIFICAGILLLLYKTPVRKQFSVLFFTIVVLIIHTFSSLTFTLLLLLGCMSFKLIMGFAANWKTS